MYKHLNPSNLFFVTFFRVQKIREGIHLPNYTPFKPFVALQDYK
jgi:hypothetical protein